MTEGFSAALTLGQTSVSGTWYMDRANPNGFAALSAAPDGRPNTLKHSIAAADNRPDDGKNTQSGKNTQGRAFNLPAGATSAQIDLFIPESFATATGRRLAGFWGTAIKGSNAVSAYPIIEFTTSTGTPQFRLFSPLKAWNEIL